MGVAAILVIRPNFFSDNFVSSQPRSSPYEIKLKLSCGLGKKMFEIFCNLTNKHYSANAHTSKVQRPLAAMFFKISKFFEQTLNIGRQGTSMQKIFEIGPAVSDKKIF